jgi:uncharacterized protein (TIGR02466 family)
MTKIDSIFPIPIYQNNIGRPFSKKEKEFVLECEKFFNLNSGNTTSANNYVLDEEPMSDIKSFIQNCVQDYMNCIVKPRFDVNIRITQSWFNYTKPNQFHHKHSHPNSFISGVLYINADPEKDKIIFHSPYCNYMYNLHCPSVELGDFNSNYVYFINQNGGLILFPSKTQHSVDITQSKETRISLAFNTFLNGEIGDDKSLTGLWN